MEYGMYFLKGKNEIHVFIFGVLTSLSALWAIFDRPDFYGGRMNHPIMI